MQAIESNTTAQIRASREAITALVPPTPVREVTFEWVLPNGESVTQKYVQAELGMFPAQEFGTMITEILDDFTTGKVGFKIGELFRSGISMPTNLSPETANDLIEDNMELIKAFIKALQILPNFQQDVMCLSLGIPPRERAWAKTQLVEPPHRGGLTVEEGFDLLIWFIRQNATLVKKTVVGKARELVDVFKLEILEQEPVDSTEEEEPTETTDLPSSPGGTPSTTSSPATQENV